MRIGFHLPQTGTHAHNYDKLPGYAKALEELGAHSLWVSDRILAPVHPTVGYAGTDSIPKSFHSVLDPLAVLTAIGSVTSRVQIGSNVLIAPWYPPILLARALTTIDLISHGRLIVGMGTGWSPEEYQSVGVPMNQRGSRLDECLDILGKYWTDNPVEYQGKHWTIPPTYVELKPVRKPPVYLAAFAPASFARTGRRADGWMPAIQPGDDYDTTFLSQSLAAIRAEAEKAGRDPGAIDAIVRVNPRPGYTLDGIVATMTRIHDNVGVDHLYLDVNAIAESHDHALDLARQVYERLN